MIFRWSVSVDVRVSAPELMKNLCDSFAKLRHKNGRKKNVQEEDMDIVSVSGVGGSSAHNKFIVYSPQTTKSIKENIALTALAFSSLSDVFFFTLSVHLPRRRETQNMERNGMKRNNAVISVLAFFFSFSTQISLIAVFVSDGFFLIIGERMVGWANATHTPK